MSITGTFTPPPYNSPYLVYLDDKLKDVLIKDSLDNRLKTKYFTIDNLNVNTLYTISISTGGSVNVFANISTPVSPIIKNLDLTSTQTTITATFSPSYGKTYIVLLNDNDITSSVNITPAISDIQKLTFTKGDLTPYTLYNVSISTGGSAFVSKPIYTLNNTPVRIASITNPTYNSIQVNFVPSSYSNSYIIKLDANAPATRQINRELETIYPTITQNTFSIDNLNVNTVANIYISCGYGDPGVYAVSRTPVSPPIKDAFLSASYNYIIANITPPDLVNPVGPYTFNLNGNIISTQIKIQEHIFKIPGLYVNYPYTLAISTGGSDYTYKSINTLPSTPIGNLTLYSSYTTISGTFTPSPYGTSYNISLSLNGNTTDYSNLVSVYTKGVINGETQMGFDIFGLTVNTLYTVGISTSGSVYVYKDINTSPSTPISNLVVSPSYITISGNFVPSFYGNTYSVFVGDTDYTNKTTLSKINNNLMSFIINNLQVFTYYSVKISTAGSRYVIANTRTLACPPVGNLNLVATSKQSITASFIPSPYTSYYNIYYNNVSSGTLIYDVNGIYTSPSLTVENGTVRYIINSLTLNTLYNINVSTCTTSNTYASIKTLPASPVARLTTSSSFNNIELTFVPSVDATTDYTIYYNEYMQTFNTSFSTINLTGLLVNKQYTLGISTSGSDIVYGNTYTIPAEPI